MTRIWTLLVLLGLLHPVFGQFEGSTGDGYDSKDVVATHIDGKSDPNIAPFVGGVGDGYVNNQAYTILFENLDFMYTGGRDDGYSGSISYTLLNNVDLSVLFSGGEGDGFDLTSSQATLLTSPLDIYSGGIGDGFTNHTRTTLLDGFDFAVLLNGGHGDGFTVDELTGFLLAILPVEWISFEAVKQETSVLLLWSTATETNSEKFVVERSADAIAFVKINEMSGAGNTSQRQDYQDVDFDPLNGYNYYRIKQIDFDGSSSYTDIRSVLFEEDGEFAVKIYPNPNKERILNIDVSGLETDGEIQVSVFNVSGQHLLTDTIDKSGRLNLNWNWPAGTYFIKIKAGETEISKTLVLVD